MIINMKAQNEHQTMHSRNVGGPHLPCHSMQAAVVVVGTRPQSCVLRCIAYLGVRQPIASFIKQWIFMSVMQLEQNEGPENKGVVQASRKGIVAERQA